MVEERGKEELKAENAGYSEPVGNLNISRPQVCGAWEPASTLGIAEIG